MFYNRIESWLRPYKNTASVFFLVMAAFLSIAADVQPFSDAKERFIGHGDQADVAIVARNLAEGNGAVTDCVWLLHGGGRPGNDVRHPEGYWSIYVAGLLAPFFSLLGANRQTILFVAGLTKILIAFCSASLVYRFSRSHLATIACGLILLFTPQMTGHVNALSDIYLTACILFSVTAMTWAITRQSRIAWFLAGVLTGLAVGMKPSGLIMLGLFSPFMLFVPQRLSVIARSGFVLVGFLLAVAPLAIHNYRAAGTVFWPDYRLVSSAASLRDMRGLTNNAAFYDPTIPPSTIRTFSAKWCNKRLSNLSDFFLALIDNNTIVPIWLLPFVFYALVRQIGQWWRARCLSLRAEEIFVAATLLLTCAAFCLGAMVHIEPRYWNFLVPVFSIVGISVCAGQSRIFVIFALLVALASGVGYLNDGSKRAKRKQELVALYHTVDPLMPEGAVVMTSNPWEFSFHTRRLSVMLPFTGKDEVVQDVAHRYGAEYLVIVNRDARHPHFDNLENGQFPPYLEPVYYSNSLVVGRFKDNSTPNVQKGSETQSVADRTNTAISVMRAANSTKKINATIP